ncbi:hypothetical protein GLOTRDRAFT_129326 [Gloeophyllum trabeum ATCC 11539]|uniref:Uncharacterized protein n=1 Tax=Gloeophyllum trabeum (strain ATCC 11539 / FP-39264 / Madison 617) TaxID=670483 RepID=S7Q6I0_GLOTA|nr:uncharacterized protein GLOTRDRAFT_129326 [Gloeophyllum trabeum ATCC 11539]EPQ55023.1 hypothetical protein GLOTRDRAFT_129326 [Gloeophyllum trabeum ATCC 11539]
MAGGNNNKAKTAAASASTGRSDPAGGWKDVERAFMEQARKDSAQIDQIEKDCPTFTSDGAKKELSGVNKIMKEQKEAQDKRVKDVKRLVEEDFKVQAITDMRAMIKGKIMEELARQVKAEVDGQIKDHLRPTLLEQIKEAEIHLANLKNAIHNTEALTANSKLQGDDLHMPLAPLRKADHSMSGCWPENIYSLCGYSNNTLKQLLRDYDLPVQDSQQANVDKFLAFIGVTFSPVVIDDSDDGDDVPDGAPPGYAPPVDPASGTILVNV